MKLKYGHSDIQVAFDKRFSDHHDLGNQQDYRVRVALDQSDIQQAVTLIHELFHVFFQRHQLGLPYDVEERVVSTLSDSYVEVLIRNPKLHNWLGEKIYGN